MATIHTSTLLLDFGNGFYNNGPDQNYGYGAYDPATETANVTASPLLPETKHPPRHR